MEKRGACLSIADERAKDARANEKATTFGYTTSITQSLLLHYQDLGKLVSFFFRKVVCSVLLEAVEETESCKEVWEVTANL